MQIGEWQMLHAYEELRIVPFDDKWVADPRANEQPLPLLQFDAARTRVLAACGIVVSASEGARNLPESNMCADGSLRSRSSLYAVRPNPIGNERYIYIDVLRRGG